MKETTYMRKYTLYNPIDQEFQRLKKKKKRISEVSGEIVTLAREG